MDPYYEQQRRIEEEKEEKRIKKLEKKNIKAKQPKKVQCPKCNNIVITNVKEECNYVALVLLLLPPLFLIACCCVYEHERQCFCTKRFIDVLLVMLTVQNKKRFRTKIVV